MIDLLCKLVSHPSVSPDDAGIIDYLQDYLTDIGGECVRVDRCDTKNLIAIYGDGDTSLAFAGHVDVVPAGIGWSKDPFSLQIENDILIGRGVADMKGAIVAFIFALKKFLLNYKQPYKIFLLFTSDEEGSAKNGTIAMVEYCQNNNIKFDNCIVGEASSKYFLGDEIKIGRRGSLNGDVSIYGKQGHIAYSELAINPIHKSLKVFSELVEYKFTDTNTSLQFSNIIAGTGVDNMIPNILNAKLNIRYNDNYYYKELQTIVDNIFQKHDIDYNINWRLSAEPFMSKQTKLINILKDVIKNTVNIDTKLSTDGGTSDGRFLIKISNEIVEIGLKNTTIHQANESISISDLTSLNAIYYNILIKLFCE